MRLMRAIRQWLGLELTPEQAAFVRAWQQRRAQDIEAACDICSGRAVYTCPYCHDPIKTHSHENDFLCERHGFINPIRSSDGAKINGDGFIHPTYETCE